MDSGPPVAPQCGVFDEGSRSALLVRQMRTRQYTDLLAIVCLCMSGNIAWLCVGVGVCYCALCVCLCVWFVLGWSSLWWPALKAHCRRTRPDVFVPVQRLTTEHNNTHTHRAMPYGRAYANTQLLEGQWAVSSWSVLPMQNGFFSKMWRSSKPQFFFIFMDKKFNPMLSERTRLLILEVSDLLFKCKFHFKAKDDQRKLKG